MKRIYELHGQGESIRGIAKELDIARNTVRKYLRDPGVLQPKPRPHRASKLDPFKSHILGRLAEGIDNCAVLLRELREMGYDGGYSILKEFVKPLRPLRQPKATVRFETQPGEQAQVDFGLFRYRTLGGVLRRIWAFVMVLSWSRAIYVEFIRMADTAQFIRCHIHAFQHFGGIPLRCLYDNTKVVVLGRNEDGTPNWNALFLDFSLRLGFEARLCRPYRAQTKGRVENGIRYLRGNFWPTVRFVDEHDLNRQVAAWRDGVADLRVHGTTRERPIDRLKVERAHLAPLPDAARLTLFLRESRKVGTDGYVQWEGSWYGVHWHWAGKTVQVQAHGGVVEIFGDGRRLAVHPQAHKRGMRFPLPDQWSGLAQSGGRPVREPLASQLPEIDVQQRALTSYDHLVQEVSR